MIMMSAGSDRVLLQLLYIYIMLTQFPGVKKEEDRGKMEPLLTPVID